ncbi:MAG TPA: hypothetical protein VFH68_21380 [Polyangia bacterium]|nr:hypothetical protein [Polyangia bacterium]
MKRHPRNFLPVALVSCLACLTAACRGRNDAANRAAVASLDQALAPAFVAAALRKLGGAHFHATTRISVTAAATASNEAGWDTVTTTTDVWLDRGGNYRIVETNDQDGGREVVLFGHELSVALRYGKMIRRRAQDPEPERLLEEALGGPWAAWEVAAAYAIITHHPVDLEDGRKGEEYQVSKSDRRNRKAVKIPPGIRHWRSTAAVLELNGRMTLDSATGALAKADLVTVFAAERNADSGGGPAEPVVGTVDVQTALDQVGKVPAIARPAAEELSLRQRIVPEQKEMLGGLTGGEPMPAAGAKDGKSP